MLFERAAAGFGKAPRIPKTHFLRNEYFFNLIFKISLCPSLPGPAVHHCRRPRPSRSRSLSPQQRPPTRTPPASHPISPRAHHATVALSLLSAPFRKSFLRPAHLNGSHRFLCSFRPSSSPPSRSPSRCLPPSIPRCYYLISRAGWAALFCPRRRQRAVANQGGPVKSSSSRATSWSASSSWAEL